MVGLVAHVGVCGLLDISQPRRKWVVAVYGATGVRVSSGKSFVYAAASCIQPFHNALKCQPSQPAAVSRSQQAEEHGRAYREREGKYDLEEGLLSVSLISPTPASSPVESLQRVVMLAVYY